MDKPVRDGKEGVDDIPNSIASTGSQSLDDDE